MSRRERLSPTLRLACVAEEDRALFVSYGVASLMALAWLTLVHVLPATLSPPPAAPDDRIIVVVPPFDLPLPSLEATADASARRGSAQRGSRGGSSVGDLFAGSTGLVDAGNILRNVDVSPTGAAPGDPSGLKVGLGTGAGSRTPGRTGAGGATSLGPGVGKVGGGGDVSRSAVIIAAPEVRAVAPGGVVGNASEVGQIVRARVSQLERCYHREGLSRNASLAGLVRLALTVEGGRVTAAQIIDRSWVGAGVAETEACLLSSVRGWRLGASDARIVLPLSFTSGGR